MDKYNDQDTAHENAGLQHWQNAEKQQRNESTDHNEVDLRSAEAGGYGLDRENAYDAVNAAADKDHENDAGYDEENDDKDSGNEDDDDATMDDWGDVDPASGPAPASPGSAV